MPARGYEQASGGNCTPGAHLSLQMALLAGLLVSLSQPKATMAVTEANSWLLLNIHDWLLLGTGLLHQLLKLHSQAPAAIHAHPIRDMGS